MLVIKWLSRISVRFYSTEQKSVMKYLNVAEKNDAAKNIVAILSKGNSQRREGISPYNKIYEFSCPVLGEQAQMVMTSVSGHLLNYAFTSTFKNWKGCNPSALFEAPVIKICIENGEKIKKTLEREIKSCQGLIIWTDCDREGENIGFEIIKVCSDVKPDLRIYRAKFSEITAVSVFRALSNLGQPDKRISDAVDVRQEMDLRTGAAFTRLQTLRLQKVFPQKLSDRLISYGSCQFPTLGFVVERYQQIENFIAEPFWKIKMNHKVNNLTTEFNWKRERLFDKNSVEAILDICKENQQAKVESVEGNPKSKWRPLPLDTVELEKSASRKLKMNAKHAMNIAEKLYTKGFISYPRTETNIFPKELNLTPLVQKQTNDNQWGPFAQRVLNEGGPRPRQGKKSDQAHPPIHPIKYAENLEGDERKLYEFIVRHFLACVYKDAQGFETTVTVDIAEEKFTAKGLIILERNYLDVYIYEKWNGKEINNYQQGDTFTPTVLELNEGSTSPPKLLTEADLIALMEKNGIGTDATHAEHIDTIKSREYVGLHENIYFVPGNLGMGLVEGYNNIGLEVSLAKPTLRADFENDLKLICDGLKDPQVVLQDQIQKYKAVFETVAEKMNLIDSSLSARLNDQPVEYQPEIIQTEMTVPIFKCSKCNMDMIIRTRKEGQGKFISCTGFPNCKNALWLPNSIETIEPLPNTCPRCGPNVKQVKIKFRQNPFPGDPNPNTYCLGGCDTNVVEALNINPSMIISNSRSNLQNLPVNANRSNNNNQNTLNTFLNRSSPPPNRPEPNRTNLNRSSSSRSDLNNSNTLGIMPGPSRNNSFNNSNVAPDQEIVCSCNIQAVNLTVRKEGPNTGRKFYKCANNACNFFLWDPNQENDNSIANNQVRPGAPKCECHLDAVEKTVQKEGPNKGRHFYCCSKPMGQGCKFFKWCDEAENNGNGDDFGGGGGGRGRGRGRGGFKNKTKEKTTRTAPYSSQTRAKRKCGICGQEGHTRNRCPNA